MHKTVGLIIREADIVAEVADIIGFVRNEIGNEQGVWETKERTNMHNGIG